MSAPSGSAAAAGSEPDTCAACGAPLAADQRYCLECGERRATMSSVLLAGPPVGAGRAEEAPRVPPTPPGQTGPGAADGSGRPNTTAVIAGVGVLLIAMGVGVLIGRSGQAKSSPAPAPQVITVGSSTPAPSSAAEGASASFTGDWPSGANGYTVQLQTLPSASTQASAVEAAKASATAKGAKEVGALKSEEFSSLPSGDYVIYSGVDHTKPEAEKALSSLKKSFPSASVIHVANGSSSSSGGPSSGASSSGGSSGSGAGASESRPAPPSTVESLSKKHGQSYEQESKSLPNVVSTG